jgi:hypothetical protein
MASGREAEGRAQLSQTAEAVLWTLLERVDINCACMRDQLLEIIESEQKTQSDERMQAVLAGLKSHIANKTNKEVIIYNVLRILRNS